jgi:hypothetical protein
MRERPVGVQPEVVVAAAPGRGDRVRLLDHERVTPGSADRPGRRQPCRARADNYDVLIHGASYRPRHGECYQDGLVRRGRRPRALAAFWAAALGSDVDEYSTAAALRFR